MSDTKEAAYRRAKSDFEEAARYFAKVRSDYIEAEAARNEAWSKLTTIAEKLPWEVHMKLANEQYGPPLDVAKQEG